MLKTFVSVHIFDRSHMSPLLDVLSVVTGPGCSSFGYGAMEELGPFRVHSDGKTLYQNCFSWNHGLSL